MYAQCGVAVTSHTHCNTLQHVEFYEADLVQKERTYVYIHIYMYTRCGVVVTSHTHCNTLQHTATYEADLVQEERKLRCDLPPD